MSKNKGGSSSSPTTNDPLKGSKGYGTGGKEYDGPKKKPGKR